MNPTSFVTRLCVLLLLFTLPAPGADPPKAKGVLGDASSIAEEKPAEEPAPAAAPEPSELVWWNREIATFRSPVAKLTPEVRAADALKRIEEASDQLVESGVTTEEAEIDGETAIRFLVGETYLFSLLQSDLDELSGETLDSVRTTTLAHLEEVRQARIEQGSAQAIASGVTSALVATAIFIAALVLLRMITRVGARAVERRVRSWKRLHLARADLRPHVATLAEQLVKISALSFGFYLLCVWGAFVFNQFPLTEPLGSAFTERLRNFGFGLLRSAAGAIPGLFTAGFILLIARWLARMVDRVIRSMGDDSDQGLMATDTAKATRRIAIAVIWIFALVLAYPYLPGSGSDAFKGISVLIGLMISLGSSGLINQVMSGFVLLYSGSVRTGEYVRLGEIEGTITEMGILAVKILTPQREYLTIPNAVMVSNPSTNFSRLQEETGVPVITVVTIGYDAPWRQVHRLLTSAAADSEGILDKPEPYVIQKALSDWYAEYTLTCYTGNAARRGAVLSALNGRVQDAFNEAGIQIMSPHYKDDPPQPLVIPKDRWFPQDGGDSTKTTGSP
ncbi:mechanosensitive ion channel family protein [Luteolibacter marinus]|uniref:mechanosensitive ion channel family protein n=1 Tax=Luteolibacter marinus TaxID=2776705 RepID=UPI00186847F6|nr:mechanosensitive ion channel family protein [Luteolibacter marinus]